MIIELMGDNYRKANKKVMEDMEKVVLVIGHCINCY